MPIYEYYLGCDQCFLSCVPFLWFQGITICLLCSWEFRESTLVVMLGLTMLAKSVEEEAQSNDQNILICRDHSKWYTPHQIGDQMSKGIGNNGDVSMEGATILYKSEGSDNHQKYVNTFIWDLPSGLTQNMS